MNILDIRVEDLPEGTTHYDLEEFEDFHFISCLRVNSSGSVAFYDDDPDWVYLKESLQAYTRSHRKPVTIQDILDAQQTRERSVEPPVDYELLDKAALLGLVEDAYERIEELKKLIKGETK